MDLERMLAKCRRLQWDADEDLDWTTPPARFDRDDEIAIVQYFTDMSAIELLAGQLFEVQRDLVDDPTLKAIFATFVVDEKRHSAVAARLARHYDLHRYRAYEVNPYLRRFAPTFKAVLEHVSPEVANAYITSGEILLDIALLRSLNDFVGDAMSDQAMRLINRDESRHIAIDYFMVEYYASERYAEWEAAQPAKRPLEKLRGMLTFVAFMWRAGPFLRDVFFRPMDLTDPSGRRLLEAFRRIQLIGLKEEVAKRPFNKFMRTMQDAFNHPVIGPIAGPAISRFTGIEPRVLRKLYSPEDEVAIQAKSFAEMAAETLAMKGPVSAA